MKKTHKLFFILIGSIFLLNNYKLSAQANAGEDQEGCTDFFTLNGSDPGSGSGEWIIISGNVNIDNPYFNNTTITVEPGVSVLQWTVDDGGDITSDEVQITNNSITTSAGGDQIACTNYATLEGEEPATGSGLWSLISGGGTFEDPNLYNTIVNDLPQGASIFRWTVTSNGCEAFAEVQITNNSFTTSAGTDLDGCDNYATLDGQEPEPGYSGTWSIISGGGTFTDPNLYNTNVTGLSQGTNTIRWTVNGNGCSPYDEVQITNNGFTATAGTDQASCNNYATLDGQEPESGHSGTWSIISGGGTFTTATLFNTSVTDISEGANIFRWTVIGNSCSSYDEVQITNNSLTATAGTDQAICVDYATLNAQAPAIGSTGTWTFISGGGNFTDQNLYNTTVTGLSQGINTLGWTVSGNSCSANDEVQITNNSIATSAGPDQASCNNYATLSGLEPSLDQAGTWSLISGGGTITNPSLYNTTLTGITQGANTFRWTVTGNSCSATDDVIITNNTITANAGPDAQITNVAAYTLNGNQPNSGAGLWTSSSPQVVFDNNSLYNATASNIPNGSTTFIWTITNNCGSVFDEMIVTRTITALETLLSKGIKIYPNPSTGKFNIEFEKIDGFKDVVVIGLNGQILLKQNIAKNKETVDLSKMGDGIYLIKIQHYGEELQTKIIIQNK